MPDSETERHWMEEELERSLRRVSAPEELWERIESPQKTRARVRTRFMAWASVPAVMLVALWGSHPRNDPAIQFRSSDPAEIRAWVNANSGLDVPLHAGHLAGASILSARKAEIVYRFGSRDVSLFVSSVLTSVRRDEKTTSWMAGGQAYLLACAEPEDLKACLLCHVGG